MPGFEELRVGLLQSQLQWRNPEENRAHLQARLERDIGDADLVVMPETFTTGFLGDDAGTDEGMDGPTVAWMRDMARNFGCTLAGSAVIVVAAARLNRMLWVEPDGRVLHYDKKHLFSFAGEDRRYAAGEERVIIGYGDWRICPQICYDIRFPVWCRNRDDYDVMLVVANWPAPRIDAWSALLRARAIENQSWVVAVNRVGEDGHGKAYPGRSVVHDPLGETIARLGDQEEYAEATLRLADVRAVREEFPFQADADHFEITAPGR